MESWITIEVEGVRYCNISQIKQMTVIAPQKHRYHATHNTGTFFKSFSQFTLFFLSKTSHILLWEVLVPNKTTDVH